LQRPWVRKKRSTTVEMLRHCLPAYVPPIPYSTQVATYALTSPTRITSENLPPCPTTPATPGLHFSTLCKNVQRPNAAFFVCVSTLLQRSSFTPGLRRRSSGIYSRDDARGALFVIELAKATFPAVQTFPSNRQRTRRLAL
jgi:hypothetical protein